MKVAMYYKNSDVRIEHLPVPAIGENEILVKIMASGICGTDVLEWYRIKKAPIVLGHEMSGIIEEAGENVSGYRPGDRVFATHHVPCNVCRQCLEGHHTACHTLHTTNFFPGGFAQYVRVPEINVRHGLFKLPDNMSFDEGTFIEPLGTVVRGQRIAGIQAGQTVMIIGSGIAGLLHIKLAKASGVSRIIATDVSDYRLNAASEAGADITVNAMENVPVVAGKADVVIVCSGAMSAARQALQCVDKGGTVLFFAVPTEDLPVPMNDFWRNEIKIVTSYAAAPADLAKSIDLMSSGVIDVKDLVTHRLPLDDAQQGFTMVASAQDSLKIILYPHMETEEI